MTREKIMNYRMKHVLIILLALWAIGMLIVARFQKVSPEQAVFEFMTLGAVILRSAVFLILDRTPKNCVEDE